MTNRQEIHEPSQELHIVYYESITTIFAMHTINLLVLPKSCESFQVQRLTYRN